MQNLLKCGVIKKEEHGLSVELYQLSGEARPKINEIMEYHWYLTIRGNNK